MDYGKGEYNPGFLRVSWRTLLVYLEAYVTPPYLLFCRNPVRNLVALPVLALTLPAPMLRQFGSMS